MGMSDRTILAAQVGYGMFGGDVVAGTTSVSYTHLTLPTN